MRQVLRSFEPGQLQIGHECGFSVLPRRCSAYIVAASPIIAGTILEYPCPTLTRK
jgi:hypothetical protein